ncbi:MAG: DUF1330 domain-containing protein [Proteobacteria bacterium]|nr:DUF1330 domain-containing protein [Pseudomonadota bacterium]MDA1331334.1 DUF1330 domain-containing protein [Pseudomonadota bacterium]
MAKAYWIAFYHSINDPEAMARYSKLARPAIEIGGGRFMARGMPAKVYEAGKEERVVMIEFDSVEQAVATHDSQAYKEALDVMGDAAVRDMRIVEAT